MGRVALQVIALHTEAKEATQRRDSPCLARRSRAMRRLLREKTTQVRRTDLRERGDALSAQKIKTGPHIALISTARQIGQTTLDTTVDEKVRQGVKHGASVSGQARYPDTAKRVENPAYRPAKESPANAGFFYETSSWSSLHCRALCRHGSGHGLRHSVCRAPSTQAHPPRGRAQAASTARLRVLAGTAAR